MKNKANNILKSSMALNKLTYKDLCFICAKSESTVFKWLNNNLSIDDFSLYKLYRALYGAKLIIPRELYRYCYSSMQKTVSWAKKSRSGNEKPTYFGVKINEDLKGLKFIYDNELLSRSDIAKITKNKLDFILGRTRTVKHGVDVTEIINKAKYSRSK